MGFLIAAFVLLFLLLLLSVPLILEMRVRIGLRGACARAKLFVFGLIPIPLTLSVRLLSEPYFTLQIGRKPIPLFGKKPSGGEIGLLKGVRLLSLHTVVTVGIEDDPAYAVLAAGSIAVLLSMLTARYAETGSANARLSQKSMIRLSVAITALLFPAEMIAGFLRARRIAKKKSANNNGKTSEKRKNYASG